MKTQSNLFLYCFTAILLTTAIGLQAENDYWMNRKIRMPKSKGTVYELLEKISKSSGYLFIYDNNVINNEQEAQINRGEYTIQQAIYTVTGNTKLSLRLIGKHILIEPLSMLPASTDSLTHHSITGTLIDKYTGEPVQYATIGIITNAIGTVSNGNGSFRFNAPDSLKKSGIRISHVGYITHETDMQSIAEQAIIKLEPKVISIQEVVVRLVNPIRLLHDMIDNREKNYSSNPVYFTSFYREGVERKKGFVSMSEAVFKIYKAPFGHEDDQVKLLKMRRISNNEEKDTLILKIKSGISSCLILDIAKKLPDFLMPENESQYNFLQSDITEMDGRMTYVISFEQKKYITEPLYTGQLYIDAESYALVSARFELHPKYIETATDMFVTRKSRNLNITVQKAEYQVTYKAWNGKYYVNHIRGDLFFKIKKTNRFFSASVLHTWFEMATCRIESDNVARFSRNETLQTGSVFSETKYTYDNRFWENFNIILPEEQLNEAISKINSKTEAM